MKFENIVVSGIANIVVNRKTKWTQLPSNVWQRHVPKGEEDMFGRGVYTHDQMMEIVQHLKEDRRYRMWIHGDTLNIVRREQTCECPRCCE